MSENLVPYGVGFFSGATVAMLYKNPKVRNLLKKNDAQDVVVGVSYSKKSSPTRVKEGDEEEPLTQQEAEATYVDMQNSAVSYTNWPPGADLQEQEQNVYEQIEYPANLSSTISRHVYENVNTGAVSKQHVYQNIEYATLQQQRIYEPIEYQPESVHIYEPISPPRTDVERQ